MFVEVAEELGLTMIPRLDEATSFAMNESRVGAVVNLAKKEHTKSQF